MFLSGVRYVSILGSIILVIYFFYKQPVYKQLGNPRMGNCWETFRAFTKQQ